MAILPLSLFSKRHGMNRRSLRKRRQLRTVEALEDRRTMAGDLASSIHFGGPPVVIASATSGQSHNVDDNSPLLNLTAGATLDSNSSTLFIRGTTGNDVVRIRLEGNATQVEFNGQTQTFGHRLLCAAQSCFFVPSVQSIEFDGFAGDDQFRNQTTIVSTANGGTGNDMLLGGAARDVLRGDAGNDTLLGEAGNDDLQGGLGDDSILGGSGDDTLLGQDGRDYLYGGAGNDRILGGEGQDNIQGGIGNDYVEGGANDDSISGGVGNDTLSGQDGLDKILAGDGDDQVWGDDGNDTIDGGRGADRLFGGAGDDQIFGQADDDSIEGHAGNDYIVGGLGNDILSGQEGADNIHGDDGNDSIYGDDGNDILAGGRGVDYIWGQSGGDRIDGGPDYDYLWGGAGVDRFQDDGIEGLVPWVTSTSQNTIGDFDYNSFERLANGHFAWADVFVGDDPLRAVVRDRVYADFQLDRNDMLAVYKQVRADNYVSQAEYNDLRLMTQNGPLFQMPAQVRILATNVAFANLANEYWTGGSTTATPLGNLTWGGTGQKLGRLVDKWFLGKDTPTATSVRTTNYVYQMAHTDAQLWGPNGPQLEDIVQGEVGDCYFLSGIGAILSRNPQIIRDMFTDNGDGTYTVRFFENSTSIGGSPTYVTVNRELPTTPGGGLIFAGFGRLISDPTLPLWVPLVEKAYAQLADTANWTSDAANWVGQRGRNAYLGNDKITDPKVDPGIGGGDAAYVIRQVANRFVATMAVTQASVQKIINSLNNGRMVALDSKGQVAAGFVASHQYVVRSYNVLTRQFTLYNPWGRDVLCSESQLTSNFNNWYEA